MQEGVLPKGFVTIDKAVEIIESDTRKDPVVDTEFLLNNLPYLQVGRNYNIKLLKRAEDGRIVENGNTYVAIETDWEKAKLEHTITEHYKAMSGKEVDAKNIGIKYITTENDDSLEGAAKVRTNDKPMTKVGEKLGSGTKEIN